LKTTMTDRIRNTVDIITRKLSLIRALFIVSVAIGEPSKEVQEEFHRAIGDILEGKTLANLQLTYIDKDKVKQEVTWLHDHP